AAANLNAGRAAQGAGQYPEAIAFYKQAAAMDGPHFGAAATCYAGECLLAEQKPAEALDSFLKVVVLYPDDHSVSDEAQYGAGQSLEAEKEWSKAVDAYDKVIASPTAGDWAD